jgi:hypothetical protein
MRKWDIRGREVPLPPRALLPHSAPAKWGLRFCQPSDECAPWVPQAGKVKAAGLRPVMYCAYFRSAARQSGPSSLPSCQMRNSASHDRPYARRQITPRLLSILFPLSKLSYSIWEKGDNSGVAHWCTLILQESENPRKFKKIRRHDDTCALGKKKGKKENEFGTRRVKKQSAPYSLFV